MDTIDKELAYTKHDITTYTEEVFNWYQEYGLSGRMFRGHHLTEEECRMAVIIVYNSPYNISGCDTVFREICRDILFYMKGIVFYEDDEVLPKDRVVVPSEWQHIVKELLYLD